MSLPLIMLLLIVVISLFCVGLVGLSQNISFAVRLTFSLAIIFLAGWMICLYLSNVTSPFVLFFNRAVYVSPIVGMFFLGQFSDIYYKKIPPLRLSKLGLVSLITVIPGAIIAGTSLNVQGTTPRLNGGIITGYNIVPGSLSIVVAASTFILALTLILRLLLAYRTARKDIKRPLGVILKALSLTIVVSLSTNIVFPLLFGGADLADVLSSATVIVFIVSVAFSVLRYSFLDVRLLIIRSIGYVAGLTLLLVVVVLLQTTLLSYLGVSPHALDTKQRLTLASLFVFVALTFEPLRRLFARITTKVFFKDEYDTRRFISTFNTNLVKHISIRSLIASSAMEFEEALKPTYCVIGLGSTRNTPSYTEGTQHFSNADSERLLEVASASNEQFISRHYAGQAYMHTDLLKRLNTKADVELMVRLTGVIDNKETTLGYIALGPKRNGEIYNSTDFEALRVAANELELAIQNALRFEEIQRFNITLQEEVDTATQKLRRQNKRLEELDNIKDDFISMASHQLRTPLTSVKGYLSMVLEGDAGKLNGTQIQMLKQAFASSQRMVFLITDLLNVSRLKTGKFVIDTVPTKLDEVIGQELEQLHETAQAKNIELTYSPPATFPELMLDEVKIRQVIMNFVDNAIYYTPAGGHIKAELIEKPAVVEFRVTDDGIGVPKGEQHHLFTKFYRATNARKARPDGTGLGLFMAQKVILAQGGSIIFSSQENKGSTFGFTFSKSRLAVPVRLAKDALVKTPLRVKVPATTK